MFPERDTDGLQRRIKDQIHLALLGSMPFNVTEMMVLPEYAMVVKAVEDIRRESKFSAADVPSGYAGVGRVR